VTAIIQQKTSLLAVEYNAFTRLECHGRKGIWCGSDIYLIIKRVPTEVYWDHTMVKKFYVLIVDIDHTVIVPVMSGARDKFVNGGKWRGRGRWGCPRSGWSGGGGTRWGGCRSWRGITATCQWAG